jgi:hypothetical protein
MAAFRFVDRWINSLRDYTFQAHGAGAQEAPLNDLVAALEQRDIDLENHIDRMPRGKIQFQTTDAPQTAITAVTDLTGLTITFDAEAGRLYRCTGFFRLGQNVAAGLAQVVIADGAGTQLAAWQASIPAGERLSGSVELLTVPGDVKQTLKLRLSTSAGNVRAFILVEDLGAD